jgi:hypothetical protein
MLASSGRLQRRMFHGAVTALRDRCDGRVVDLKDSEPPTSTAAPSASQATTPPPQSAASP